ncbi:helix-turn-helix transcriptional regulator [Actinoplanes sp. TFC3]|uniref:helix-turn-helix domain-containing protein n=1 Tax=Actinoplanes sp. TFC3 TaxID=1710355 RepID=UPI00156F86FE
MQTIVLMGVEEIRKRLGEASTQRIYVLSRRPEFPRPVATLQSGRVWLADDVEDWLRRESPDNRLDEVAGDQALGLGRCIAQRRQQMQLTQAELAARCGVTYWTLSRVEQGKTNAKQATLQKIATALNARLVLEPTRTDQ